MSDVDRSKRSLLKFGGYAAMLSYYVGAGGISVFTKPAFSGVLKEFTADEGKTILMVGRTMFPHDQIDDGYYMNMVETVDNTCAANTAALRHARDTINSLNKDAGGSFADAVESSREAILANYESSDFFKMVYGSTINSIYGNREIWKLFGYEGSSVEHGGYVKRGFDNINWIPES